MRLNAINAAINRLFVLGGGGAAWSPADLYLSGEVGAWYDPSDLSTMFNDSAGTTPVATPGTVADSANPVGLIQDKSGNGHHASQSTSTARPLLSARVNTLTHTEDFGSPVWVIDLFGATAQLVKTLGQTDPNGGTTAARLVATLGAGEAAGFRYNDGLATEQVCRSAYIKSNTGTGESIYLDDTLITLIADTNWHRYEVSEAMFSWGTRIQFTTVGVTDITIAFMQREIGTTATPYQRVTTDSDYDGDPAKFPYYLKFDGVDDYLSTAAIDLTGTDKVTVFSGSRVLSSTVAIFYETSTNAIMGGAFYCASDYNALGVGDWMVSGNAATEFSTVADQPQRAVTTAQMSSAFTNSVGAVSVNVNGLAQTLENNYNPTATSTGNFGNHALFIGARSGPTYPFTGNLYSLIIGGALYDAATVIEAEAWVAEKTGVTL